MRNIIIESIKLNNLLKEFNDLKYHASFVSYNNDNHWNNSTTTPKYSIAGNVVDNNLNKYKSLQEEYNNKIS